MVKNKYLSEGKAAQLKKLPVKINFKPESHAEGTATYFREYLRESLKPIIKAIEEEKGEMCKFYFDHYSRCFLNHPFYYRMFLEGLFY